MCGALVGVAAFAVTPATLHAQFAVDWFRIAGGGGTSTRSGYAVSGTIGQHEAGAMPLIGGAYALVGGYWGGFAATGPGCAAASDCADLDGNSVRDDPCIWAECNAQVCTAFDIVYADMGGAFGTCPPDGFSNIHDRNHALTCFAGTNPCAGFNLDAGGAFGSCAADGFCNIHDANHALNAFAGVSSCSCPSNPAPESPAAVVGTAGLRMEPTVVRSSGHIDVVVDVHVDGPIAALRSYQLEARTSGGRAGALTLVDIVIDDRPDGVWGRPADAFSATNVATAQVLAGLDGDSGVPIEGSAYLATFVYRAADGASGRFVVDIATGPQAQTYLVAPANGRIDVERTVPAVVDLGTPLPGKATGPAR